MRLVYVTSRFPYGHGEAFLTPEVKELARRGHDVLLVPMYPRGPLVHREVVGIQGVRVEATGLFSRQVVASAARRCGRASLVGQAGKALSCVLQVRSARLKAKNLSVYAKGLWLGELAERWGADHIHAHWAATSATMAMVASMVSGIPWSFTAHRWDIIEDNLLDLKARSAAFCRFISHASMRLAWGDRRAPENATVIHMGVDLPEGVPTTRAGQPERKHFQVLSPASLTRVKGHRYLIAAVAALVKRNVPVRVWLAGEGPLREELERQIREARLCEVVTLLGQLPHQRLLELYAEGQVDAVVLASVDLGDGLHEGIPVSLIEAMAYGVPVVGTMAGGTPELLRDGAGVLVPPGDASVLSDALERLATDTAWRRELGFRGRKRVEEEFAIGRVVDALEDQFRRAVKART